MHRNRSSAACAALFAIFTHATVPAHAQQASLDRVKLSDNEMSCAQLHAETVAMDRVIEESKAQESQGNTTAIAGAAGNIATEAAARTGFFGTLGGLAGQVFGQVAGKTASAVAQQSGQTTAQQAAERARQASARKEHVSTLFLNKGCKASDLAYNPPAQTGTQANTTAPAAPAPSNTTVAQRAASAPGTAPSSLPDLDPDSYFKGKTGGTFGKNIVEVLPGNKRVAVAGFRVAFITSNTASAQVRGSYMPGRDTSGASSTLVVTLSGVDASALQALTDKAYRDFLAQLRLAGREVVPQEELREFLAGVDVTPSSIAKPYIKEVGAQAALVFAPAGMPLWFHNGDAAWGDKTPFDQKNLRSAADYSQKLNAIVIAPMIVVDFARMMSSGNQSGFVARSAETGAALSLHVSRLFSQVIRSEETRSGLVMKGDDGNVALSRAVASELPFGELKTASATDNRGTKGIFDALGRSMGMANAGGANRQKTESVAETNDAKYSAAAADALVLATGALAKLFQKYPAR